MKRKLGIFWKYFIAYSTTATVMILILAASMNAAIQRRYEDIVFDYLRKHAVFAGEAFRTTFDSEPDNAQKITRELGTQTGARITLILPDGTDGKSLRTSRDQRGTFWKSGFKH